MCSSDSGDSSQVEHRALFSRFVIRSQKSPIRRALLIALNRKVCIGRLMSWCLHPFQMALFGRDCLFTSSMEILILSSVISTRRGVGGLSRLDMWAYARACDIFVSLIPFVWKCSGTDRSISSAVGLLAPSLASLSASSFPWVPLWPFTHLKWVGALLRRSWYAVAFIHVAFGTFVQPESSSLVSEWLSGVSSSIVTSDYKQIYPRQI